MSDLLQVQSTVGQSTWQDALLCGAVLCQHERQWGAGRRLASRPAISAWEMWACIDGGSSLERCSSWRAGLCIAQCNARGDEGRKLRRRGTLRAGWGCTV